MTLFRRPYRSAHSRKGVAAVEFAVVLPIMALLIVGLWEVGRMVEVQQYLANACREGARQASTGVKTTAQVQQVVVDYLQQKGLTNVKTANVTVTSVSNTSITDPSQATQLDQFRVSVSVPFTDVRWVALNQITGLRNLTASADWYSMRDIPITVSATIPLK
ncbi:MAG: TadE/TadG family type IV pilus assembly protein [Planctomycetota bacterium]